MSDRPSGGSRICAECGYNNPATFKFCTNCGAALPVEPSAEPPLRPTMPFEPVQGPAAPLAEQPTAHAPTIPLSAVTDEAARAWEQPASGASAPGWSTGGEQPAYRTDAEAAWPATPDDRAAPTSLPEPFGATPRPGREAPVLDAMELEDVGWPGQEEAPDLSRPGAVGARAAAGYSAVDAAGAYARRAGRSGQPLPGALALEADRRSQTACLIVGFIAAAVLACVVGMAAGVLLVSLWFSL